jgi:hypothetical protein
MKIARCILFLFLLAAAVIMCGEVLTPFNDTMQNWLAIYEQPSDSIDVLFVGNSHSFATFDTEIFDETLGGKSIHLSTNSQNVVQTYYNVKEVLKYQKPGLIVLEAYAIRDNDNFRPEDRDWKKESNFDGMRWSANKASALFAQYLPENYLYAAFPLYRNHSNWVDFASIYTNIDNMLNENHGQYTGFRPSVSSMSPETVDAFARMEYSDKPIRIADSNLTYFKLLARLCEDEGIKLVVVMAPMFDVYIEKINYKSWYDALTDLTAQCRVTYIDYNLLYYEIGLTSDCFEDAFNGYHHTNGKGAEYVSRDLAAKLAALY